MRWFELPHACTLLLIPFLGQNVAALQQDVAHPERVLRAATKRSDFFRRSMRITRSFETEVAYVESKSCRHFGHKEMCAQL